MLTLHVRWLASAYEATHDGTAEWPPHPARAFCALVAAATPGSADDEALRWLESQAPPVVEVPAASTHRREAFVVTNAVEATGGHQTHLWRTSGSRSWTRSLPARPLARFVWPAADAGADRLAVLDELARRVPYLGRSTSPVLLAFSAEPGGDDDGLSAFEPGPGGRSRLRVPHRGYLDQLRSAYADAFSDKVTVRPLAYRGPGDVESQPAAKDAANPMWPHLITLGFAPGVVVEGRHALAVATGFKAAVLSRLGKPRPGDDWEPLSEDALQLLHGHFDHRADNRRQCAFMALPFVGGPHATGGVLGVGLALSANLETEVLSPLLRLLGYDRAPDEGPRLDRITIGRGRTIVLRRADGRVTVDPARWTRASAVWDTVLPIVLDRFPRRRYTLADAVADGCEWAGFERPESVEIRPASAVPGAPYISGTATQRPDGPPRPSVHARIWFPGPVKGPVLLGHFRHLGLGLCVPSATRPGS